MKKTIVFLAIVVFIITLAMPILGAEKPKGVPQQTAPLPMLICKIEGTINVSGTKIPTGSTIACPVHSSGITDSVFLHLFVKNAGGVVAQGNISISGNVREPVGSNFVSCYMFGMPTQCPTAIAYVDRPFSVQPNISFQPGNAVEVYSTKVDLHCARGYIGSQYFPEEIRMSAQVAGAVGVGGIPIRCMYHIKINKKMP